MIGTKDGAKIGILCVKYGNAKVCATSFLSIEMCRILMIIGCNILFILHVTFLGKKEDYQRIEGTHRQNSLSSIWVHGK